VVIREANQEVIGVSVALERINRLMDPGSYRPMDDLTPTIHLLGVGTVGGRRVYVSSGVPEACQMDILECFHRKVRWMEKIIQDPAPIIWLHDAPPQEPGGRTPIPPHSDELLASHAGVGRVFCLQARLNGVVPQISALFGDVGAAQTFPLRLADFTLLKRGTHVWIGRPDAVKLMIGSAPDAESLGGAEMHCKVSGVGDVLFDQDHEAIAWIVKCLGCLPSRAGEAPPIGPARAPDMPCGNLSAIIPDDLNRPFDMHLVVRGLIDANSWIGIQELYAKEIIVGWGRITGVPVGILANNSNERGGVLFPESCRKMTRFIRFCEAYRIPMIFLADNPGMMVGEATERGGMLTEACDLLRALAVAQTPRICLVIRKAYTVGLYAMSGPGFDPIHFWSTPNASISVFGPKALDLFARDRELPLAAREAIREMRHHAVEPRDYAAKGYLSAVIEWRDLRHRLEEFIRDIKPARE